MIVKIFFEMVKLLVEKHSSAFNLVINFIEKCSVIAKLF